MLILRFIMKSPSIRSKFLTIIFIKKPKTYLPVLSLNAREYLPSGDLGIFYCIRVSPRLVLAVMALLNRLESRSSGAVQKLALDQVWSLRNKGEGGGGRGSNPNSKVGLPRFLVARNRRSLA